MCECQKKNAALPQTRAELVATRANPPSASARSRAVVALGSSPLAGLSDHDSAAPAAFSFPERLLIRFVNCR